MNMDKRQRTEIIKTLAALAEFSGCGISRAEKLEPESSRLESWLRAGYHGQMTYMADHADLRRDPRNLMPGAQSVVSLLYNYYQAPVETENSCRMSIYAYGKDYHTVLRKKIKNLIRSICGELGDVNARICVDSAPIMEKAWAMRSGLGWIGKHANLINPKAGSYFFLAELLLDIELEYDRPAADHCGTCRRCIEACPTGAIVEPYVVDASRCISYLTIELKTSIPEQFQGTYDDWIFGCDLCQRACPFNRFARPHSEPAFTPHPELATMNRNDWREMTKQRFEELFNGSAVKRAAYDGLIRNIEFLK